MKYVISSSEFKSKKEALERIQDWDVLGTLDPNARVYSVKDIFEPVVKIELEKVE